MHRLLLSFALATLAVTSVHAQTPAPAPSMAAPADPVIARVDGEPVLRSELQGTMREIGRAHV